ncbi:MAG: 30S ribosomal protein S1 [Oscillospiraceae bacterium]|nr:30S ribosomal protein S1 [Oscillospiraceae bacterium]
MQPYSPEGVHAAPPTAEELRRAVGTGEIFQAQCLKCDEFHNLHLDLKDAQGIIPREEAAMGIREGKTKEIAVLSRVGKWVSFQVLGFDSRGTAILSRRAAQAEAKSYFLNALRPGDIIPAVVQNTAPFGVFCDIGCGCTALMRIERCCISRLTTTAELFHPGQQIFAAVLGVDDAEGLINLTGRELLGTWEENADLFRPAQTVTGFVRSIMSYGVFVELTPNLSGLAELSVPVAINDPVSIYIRSIQHDKHKLKLTVLEKLNEPIPPQLNYFQTSGHLEQWEYYAGSPAVTNF